MHILASIPFEFLEGYLRKITEDQLPIELVLKAEVLDSLSFSEFRKWAFTLESHNVLTTVHLPFMDLCPAALDPWIRKVSLQRLYQALTVASLFKPKVCVFHSGYHPDYHREYAERWLSMLIEESLPKLIDWTRGFGLKLALENTFEPRPELLERVFNACRGELFWCFDPGHSIVFSEVDEITWFDTLSPHLVEIHCHDNLGIYDDHLALGEGVVRFQEIFEKVRVLPQMPILTVEARSEEAFRKSFSYIQKFLGQYSRLKHEDLSS